MPLPFPAARASDPHTSHAAARDAGRRAPVLRNRCLAALRAAGERGMTDFELAAAVCSQQTSAGKRRGELVKLGLVEYAGCKRQSPSGSDAMVWRVVEMGGVLTFFAVVGVLTVTELWCRAHRREMGRIWGPRRDPRVSHVRRVRR